MDYADGVENWFDVLHTGNLEELGSARIATGSYEGNGGVGVNSPNIINVDFKPMFVAIVVADEMATDNPYAPCLFVRPWGYNTQITTGNTGGKTINNRVTWGDRSVSWYSAAKSTSSSDPDNSTSANQLNVYGVVYNWVAIG